MKRIEVTVSENTTVVDVMADVDVEVKPAKDADVRMDLSDLISIAILKEIKSKALMPVGKYNIRMLCVVTTENDGTNESED